MDAYFVASLTVQMFLYSFHLFILIMLISKRQQTFNGAFFNIFRIVLAADLGSFVVGLIVRKISLIPFFVNFYLSTAFLPTAMSLATASLLTCQFLGRLLMALNRTTAIWLPIKNQILWRRQWYTVALVVLPFMVICWRIHEPLRYTYLGNGSINPVFESTNVQSIAKGLQSSIFFVTTLAAAICNALSFAKFYVNRRKSGTYMLNEQHLLYISIITFFAQLLRTSNTASQYLFPSNKDVTEFFAVALPWQNDFMALSASIPFLCLSKTARIEVIRFCGFKPSQFGMNTSSKSRVIRL